MTYLVVLSIALLLWVTLFTYSALMVRAHVNHLADVANKPEDIELSSGQVDHFYNTMTSLDRNLKRVERLTSVPLIEPMLFRVPSIGPRFEAVRTTLKIADELGSAGSIGATAGRDAYRAFDSTGISYDPDNSADTWLAAIDRHRDEIPEIVENIERARDYRRDVDESRLPAMIAERMDELDSFLNRTDELVNLAESYDQFFHTAGGEGTIRYCSFSRTRLNCDHPAGFQVRLESSSFIPVNSWIMKCGTRTKSPGIT
jgi:hypothetical protein